MQREPVRQKRICYCQKSLGQLWNTNLRTLSLQYFIAIHTEFFFPHIMKIVSGSKQHSSSENIHFMQMSSACGIGPLHLQLFLPQV